MAAAVRATGNGLELGTPTSLFRLSEPAGQHTYPYDIAPDGTRILAFARGVDDSTALKVLMNSQGNLEH
jgi:hypothetical protein